MYCEEILNSPIFPFHADVEGEKDDDAEVEEDVEDLGDEEDDDEDDDDEELE